MTVTEIFSKAIEHKGPVTIGTLFLIVLGFLGWQMRSTANEASAVRTQLLELFDKHTAQTKETATRQWQNQAAIAAGLNSLAIAVNRIEAVLRILPEDRPMKAPTIDTPKPVQLKPPPAEGN